MSTWLWAMVTRVRGKVHEWHTRAFARYAKTVGNGFVPAQTQSAAAEIDAQAERVRAAQLAAAQLGAELALIRGEYGDRIEH